MNTKAIKRLLLALVAILALVLVAGCNSQKDSPETSSAPASSAISTQSDSKENPKDTGSKETNGKLTLTVYFPNEEGTKLLAEKRTVDGNKDKYTAAVEALLAGPKEKGSVAILPKQTKLRSVKVSNGVAKVDFTKGLQKSFVGGSTGEEMLVGSLVDTLTEFDEVKKVQILVEGKELDSLSGHMDLSVPIARMTNLLEK